MSKLLTISVIKTSNDTYYQGEVLPPDQIKPFHYANIPQGYVSVAAEKDGECSECFGMGLCSCGCGHEHECGHCNGTGEARREITVCVREDYIFALADRERQLSMIKDRYGKPVKAIADWWIARDALSESEAES